MSFLSTRSWKVPSAQIFSLKFGHLGPQSVVIQRLPEQARRRRAALMGLVKGHVVGFVLRSLMAATSSCDPVPYRRLEGGERMKGTFATVELMWMGHRGQRSERTDTYVPEELQRSRVEPRRCGSRWSCSMERCWLSK